MKNIKATKKVWKRLKKLRNELGFKHYSRTIQWLFDQSLKGENLQKTTDEDPGEENIKNLEAKMVLPDIHARVDQILQEKQSKTVPGVKKEQPIILFQCMKCGKMPFSGGDVVFDTIIICPRCLYIHSLTVNRKSLDDQFLLRCMKCNHSFVFGDFRTDFWAIECPRCRHPQSIRLIVKEKGDIIYGEKEVLD